MAAIRRESSGGLIAARRLVAENRRRHKGRYQGSKVEERHIAAFLSVNYAASPSLYFPSAASIAAASFGSSGVVPLSYRVINFPSFPTRNFPKFHFTGPGALDSAPVSAA